MLSGLSLARRIASLPMVVAEVGRGIQRWTRICDSGWRELFPE